MLQKSTKISIRSPLGPGPRDPGPTRELLRRIFVDFATYVEVMTISAHIYNPYQTDSIPKLFRDEIVNFLVLPLGALKGINRGPLIYRGLLL